MSATKPTPLDAPRASRRQALGKGVELRIGGVDRRARSQPADGGDVQRAALGELLLVEDERRPNVGAHRELQPAGQLGATREGEPRRCHPEVSSLRVSRAVANA